MKKITAVLMITASMQASAATVLKCMVDRYTYVTTTGQYCPSGTVFDSILPGSDLYTATQAEGNRLQQRAINQATRPTCEQLRAKRDLLNARLRNGDQEKGLLHRSNDAHDDLMRAGCSSY